MEDYINEDPRRVGTSGLSGINTKEGQRRYAEQLGIPTTPDEYRIAASTQYGREEQPIYTEGYGNYRIDRKINDPNIITSNLENERGAMQSSFNQIINGTAKSAVLAATTIGNTLGTFFVGIPEAIAEGDFSRVYDNEITRAMKAVNDWSEEVAPNFYTDDEREHPLALRNLLSANTLGDKFIKNLGFSIGSAIVGMGAGAAINGISSIPKIAGLVANASGATKSTATLLGAMLSAVGESSFEAKNAADDFVTQNKQRLDLEHQQRLQAIQEQYGNTEMYIPMLNAENQSYRESIDAIEAQSFKAGDADFLMNMMILPATNYVQFGKMFSRGFKTAEKTTGRAAADMIRGTFGDYDITASKLKGAAKVLGRGLSEGSEEALQQYATDLSTIHNQKYIDNIYNARLDPEAQDRTVSLMQSIGQSILKTAGDESTWEQFLIGALTGLTGIPMVRSSKVGNQRRSPIYMAGNAFSEYNDYINSMNEASNLADRMNEIASKKDYITLFRGLIADNALQNDMNLAAAEGDAYNYKNAEYLSLANMVDMFARTGRINDLKAAVDGAFDINDDADLQAVIDNTTSTKTVDGQTIVSGPFVENGSKLSLDNEESKQKVKDILKKQSDKIKGVISDYENISARLDNMPGQHFTDDQRDELLWLQMQLSNWRDRAGQLTNETLLPALKTIRDNLSILKDQITERNTDDVKKEEKTQYDKALDNANKVIGFLDRIVNSNSSNVSELLFTDSKFDNKLGLISNIRNIVKNFNEDFGLSSDEVNEVFRSIDDFDKITKVYNRTKSKLEEYLKTPSKIEQVRKKTVDKIRKAENSYKGRNLRNKLEKAESLSDFRSIFEGAKETPDIKQQVINDLKETTQLAKDYVDLNETRAQVANEIANQKITDAEVLGDVSDLFDQAFNNSPNAAYYTDITAEPYQLTDYLVNKESDPDRLQKRHQTAVSYAGEILGRYNSKKSQGETLKSRAATPEQVESSRPGKTTEPLKENEQGGANPEGKGTTVKATEPVSPAVQSINENDNVEVEVGDEGSNEELKTVKDSYDSNSSDETRRESNEGNTPKPYLMGISAEYDYTKQAITIDKDGNFVINTDAFKPNANFSEMLSYFKEGFEYVNSGKLKPGDQISFGMDEIQGERRLVAFVKDGENYIPLNNISGYNSDSALSRNIGLKSLYDKINSEYDEFIAKDENKGKPYISDTTTHVADIMLGKVPFSDKLTPLKTVIDNSRGNIYTDSSPIFAILKTTGLNFGVKENQEVDGISLNEETITPLDPLSNIGRLYITTPNARRGSQTGRNTIPVTIKKVDSDWRNQSYFGPNIDLILTNIVQAAIVGNRDSFSDNLKELSKYINTRSLDIILDIDGGNNPLELFGDSESTIKIHKLKRDQRGNFVRRQDGRIQYEGQGGSIKFGPDANVEEIKDRIVNALIHFDTRYNIDIQRLNDSAYNNAIIDSGVLSTYYTSLESKSSWFVLNPIVDGKEIEAVVPQMTGQKHQHATVKAVQKQTATVPVTVGVNTSSKETVSIKPSSFTYNGKSYVIDGNNVLDSEGNIVPNSPFGNGQSVHIIATAVKGNCPTYGNRYAYVRFKDNAYVVDLQLGSILSPSSKEYKDIYRLENPVNQASNVDEAKVFHLSEQINDAQSEVTPDVEKTISGNVGIYLDPDSNAYKSNILHYVGNHNGNKIYMTIEGIYDDNGTIKGWQPYIISEDGKSAKLKIHEGNLFEAIDDKYLEEWFNAISSGKDKRALPLLNSIIVPKNAVEATKPAAGTIDLNNESNDDVNQMASLMGDSMDLFRLSNQEKEIFDKQKETEWLQKVLPNLAEQDRFSFWEGLIPVMELGRQAWGKFDGSMMTISSVAAPGTVYHEAFHAVFHLLLDSNKRTEILNEAKKAYGRELDNEELEERLADEFMNYVERSETIFGRIANFFKGLAIKRDNWRYARAHLYSLFRDINNGEYANIKPVETKLENNRYKGEEYTQEMKDILANAPRDEDGQLLAHNGKPSNLTERQYAQVRTKAFKDWFGDWENNPANSSKVVDENGEPLVVYHGSKNNTFSLFDINRVGENFEGSLRFGKAFYFTPDSNQANRWGHDNDELVFDYVNGWHPKYNDRYRAFFLNLRRPFETDWGFTGEEQSDSFKDAIKLNPNIDGVIVTSMDVIDELAVFNPNQIKSATDNIGTFDSNNPDIRYRLTDENKEYEKYLDIYQHNSAITSYPTRAQAIKAYNNLKQRYPKARIMFKEGGKISEQLKPIEGKFHVYMNKPQLVDFATPQQFSLVDDGLDYYRNLNQEQALSEAALITQEEREQFISDGHSDAFVDIASKDKTILDILKTCSGVDI